MNVIRNSAVICVYCICNCLYNSNDRIKRIQVVGMPGKFIIQLKKIELDYHTTLSIQQSLKNLQFPRKCYHNYILCQPDIYLPPGFLAHFYSPDKESVEDSALQEDYVRLPNINCLHLWESIRLVNFSFSTAGCFHYKGRWWINNSWKYLKREKVLESFLSFRWGHRRSVQ